MTITLYIDSLAVSFDCSTEEFNREAEYVREQLEAQLWGLA